MVGWVDLTSAQVARQLEALRTGYAGQRLVGVRHDVSSEPYLRWLLRTDVRHGLDAVADAWAAFDLEVTPWELAAAARVAAAHPDLRGSSWTIWASRRSRRAGRRCGGAASPGWRRSAATCGGSCPAWSPRRTGPGGRTPTWPRTWPRRPLLVSAWDRLLFGSDWPVCTLAASYGQVLAAVRRGLPAQDLDKIFWCNASAVYRLDPGALVAAGTTRSARGGATTSRPAARADSSGAVTHAGTFNGNTIATAAVLASLDELESGEVYEQIGKVGTALMQSLRDCAEASGLGLHIQGLPMAFHASFAPPGHVPVTRYRDLASSDPDRYARLADALIAQRVWVARRGIWYVSAAHTEADVAETLDRAERAFRSFQES